MSLNIPGVNFKAPEFPSPQFNLEKFDHPRAPAQSWSQWAQQTATQAQENMQTAIQDWFTNVVRSPATQACGQWTLQAANQDQIIRGDCPPATQTWGQWTLQTAVKAWIHGVACSHTTDNFRKERICEWLGLNQVNSLTKSFLPFLKPFFKPKIVEENGVQRSVRPSLELSDDHIERLVTLAIYSLAKKTRAATGKDRINLAEMIHTLIKGVESNLPELLKKVELHKYDLKEHSYEIMEPIARDLIDSLFPVSELGLPELFTTKLYGFFNPSMEYNGISTVFYPTYPLPQGEEIPQSMRPFDGLIGVIANYDNLQRILEFHKLYDNVENHEAMEATNPGIVEKVNNATALVARCIRKKMAMKAPQISEQLFNQLGFVKENTAIPAGTSCNGVLSESCPRIGESNVKSEGVLGGSDAEFSENTTSETFLTSSDLAGYNPAGNPDKNMRDWWNEQVKLFLCGNPECASKDALSVLLPFATKILGETVLNALNDMGGDTEAGHREILDGITKMIMFCSAYQDELWSLDPSQDNSALFKPLANIVLNDLRLGKAGVLALPEYTTARKLLTEMMPLILSETFGNAVYQDVRDFAAGSTQFEPVVANFSNDCAKFMTKMTMDMFKLDKGKPTQQIAELAVSVTEICASNGEMKDFLPLNAPFWTAAMSRVTSLSLAGPISDWTERYAAHAIKVVIQNLLNVLRKCENDAKDKAFLKLKRGIVQFVHDYFKVRIRGNAEPFDEKRFETACKNISDAIKGILALNPDALPFPRSYQKTLWNSIIPSAVGKILKKFCTSKYIQQQLSKLIMNINLDAKNGEDLPVVALDNDSDFLKDCNNLVKVGLLFTETPLVGYKKMKDNEGYKLIITAMNELLGSVMMKQLLETKFSDVVTAALRAAIDNDIFNKDADLEPEYNLANITIKAADKAVNKMFDEFIAEKETAIDEFIKTYFGSYTASVVQILRIVVKILLKPLFFFLYLLKKIAFAFVENRTQFSIDKAEQKFDYGFPEGLAGAINRNLPHAVVAGA